MTAFLITLGLASTLLLIGVGRYLWRQFLKTEEWRWATEVKARRKRFECAELELRDEDKLEWDRRAAWDKLFDCYIRRQPIDLLTSFAGVGNRTVDLLRSHRVRSISDLDGYNFEALRGIGIAKAQALRTATNTLLLKARATFDAGQCPEGREYRQTLEQNREREKRERAKRAPMIRAIEMALADESPRLRVANRVTFWAYLLKLETGYTDALGAEHVPTLDEVFLKVGRRGPSATPVLARLEPTSRRPEVSKSLLVARVIPDQPSEPGPSSRTLVPPLAPPIAIPVHAKPQPHPVRQDSVPPTLRPPRPSRPTPDPVAVPPTPAATPVIPNRLQPDLFDTRQPGLAKAVEPTASPTFLPRLKFFASLGMFVARCDGKIATAERAEVRRYLADKYGSDVQLVRHIDPCIEAAENSQLSEHTLLAGLKTHCTSDAERKEAYEFAERVAYAASGQSKREITTLARLADALGVMPVVPATTPIREPYALLPVPVLPVPPQVIQVPSPAPAQWWEQTASKEPKRNHDLVTVQVARPGPAGEPIPIAPNLAPNPNSIVLDRSKVERIAAETRQVQQLLAESMQSTEEESLIVQPEEVSKPMPFTGPGLNPPARYVDLFQALVVQPVWSRDAFDTLARKDGHMPSGAIEAINDWGYDRFGGQLLNEDGNQVLVELSFLNTHVED